MIDFEVIEDYTSVYYIPPVINFEEIGWYDMSEESNIDFEKGDDSMNTVEMERSGYKRLDFGALNFLSNEEVKDDSMENITPIQWTKEVLTGEKQIVIKRQ